MKRLLLVLALLSPLCFAGAARVGTVSLGFGGATYTHTLSQTPTQNNLLIVVVASNNPTQPVTISVTDSASNALSQAITTNDAGHITGIIFYEVIPAGLTTSLTIASSPANATSSVAMEYSGMATSSPLDVTVGNATDFTESAPWTTASSPTTSGSNLLIGMCAEYFGQASITYTAGSGWTTVGATTNISNAPYVFLEDQLNTTAGTYVANGNFAEGAGGTVYVHNFASFKTAAAPPTTSGSTVLGTSKILGTSVVK